MVCFFAEPRRESGLAAEYMTHPNVGERPAPPSGTLLAASEILPSRVYGAGPVAVLSRGLRAEEQDLAHPGGGREGGSRRIYSYDTFSLERRPDRSG